MRKDWPVKWQVLETKARFIQQVMSGHTSVRAAEDLEANTLTYAEIKAIASGNPAVLEKVKVDTEVRKLDQLRAAHVNQQHIIRLQLHRLPLDIAEAERNLASITKDIATRDAQAADEFTMTVGNHLYSGKGAREEAAKGLTYAVLTWRDDPALQVRGAFRGFEILNEGTDLFVRGAGMYSAHLNPEYPIGTVQSIEHTLRSLEKLAAQQQDRIESLQKTLADYQAQANRPFEHEARLKELLARQAQINALLDLDKGERQIAEPASDQDGPVREQASVAARLNGSHQSLSENDRGDLAKTAMEYMRHSRMSIVDMPISEGAPRDAGMLTGTAVACNGTHVAVATAPNRFLVLERAGSNEDVAVGSRVRIRFNRGRSTIERAERELGR